MCISSQFLYVFRDCRIDHCCKQRSSECSYDISWYENIRVFQLVNSDIFWRFLAFCLTLRLREKNELQVGMVGMRFRCCMKNPPKETRGNPCGCATKTARRDRSCGKTMLLCFFQPNPWVLRFLDLNSIGKIFEPMNAILKSVSLEPLALAQSKIWNHDKSCLWRCKCLEMPRTRCKQVRSGILNWNESQNHGNGIILLYLGGVVRDWPCEVTPKNRVV